MLTCGDVGAHHRGPGLSTIAVAARPGKAEIDPLLADPSLLRLVVVGSDADLAAVLLRLLRRERLDVELGYVAAGRTAARSAAVRTWGLPRGAGPAGRLALEGTAVAVPLARDDSGGVLVGRAHVCNLQGECYADETLVLRGAARRLIVEAGPGGIGARASRTGRRPDGVTRAVAPRAPTGHGSATARAVQVGGLPFVPVLDGVPHPRPVRRWAWYRHTQDWLLVRPS